MGPPQHKISTYRPGSDRQMRQMCNCMYVYHLTPWALFTQLTIVQGFDLCPYKCIYPSSIQTDNNNRRVGIF